MPHDLRPHLYFTGHAGFLFEYRGVSLVCDPWLSESGAFLHRWHQFPPNDFVDRRRLYEADYLYISHDHADHFDRPFLAEFPKEKVTVLVADFLSPRFVEQLSALGFPRIVRLRDWEEHLLADGFGVTALREQSLFKIDSVLMIRAGDFRMLDRNDCHLQDEDRARFRGMGIDLLLSQFSGAMWYPAAYEYDLERQGEISAGLRRALQDRFVVRANSMRPRHILHAAGPPCFLEPDSFLLNFSRFGIFHDQWETFEELSSRLNGELHLALPGDEITFDDEGELRIARSHPVDADGKKRLLMEYQERRLPLIESYLAALPRPEPGFLQRFKKHLGGLYASSASIRKQSNVLAAFHVTGDNGGSVYVDTRGGDFRISETTDEHPGYEFTLTGPVARLLADGEETWEEVLLSLRFRARRAPDEYNWPLFALLRYGHDPALIRQVERTLETPVEETILVRDGGACFRVQRYCPHTGEDLTPAQLEDGLLVCPRHRWAFNLRGGGACVRGGNIALQVCELMEDEEQEGEV